MGLIVLGVTDSGEMRLVLLSLLLVAVVLLLTGGTIALLRLFNQRRSGPASITSNPLESENS